jgi:tetratricopeptide (TPR) repeat protein
LLLAGVIEPEGVSSRGEDESEEVEPRDEEKVVPAKKETSARVDALDEQWRLEIERVFEAFQNKNHWEVLDLERGAELEEIKKAFQEKALRYHPDRSRKLDDPSAQEQLSHIFTRVSEAYETLSTQAKADDYNKLADKEAQYEEKQKSWASPAEAKKKEDKSADADVPERKRDPNEARAHYLRAKKAYDQEDYWTTIQLCQQAIEIVSDQAEYYHLLGLAQSQNPKWRLDAERNFKIATNLDPWKSTYFVALGKLYEKAGMGVRAQRAFDQAKAIDPSFSEVED